MAGVFISYLREDSDNVLRLCDALRERGVEVWIDRDDIVPGTSWKSAIREAIAQGDYFLACFSERYRSKQDPWMDEELAWAIEHARAMLAQPQGDEPARTWLIPIVLPGGEVPDKPVGDDTTLRDLQWVSLEEADWDDGVDRLVDVINPVPLKLQRLKQALQAGGVGTRRSAAGDLGKTRDPRAVPWLRAALSDQTVSVRQSAAAALGNVQDKSAITPLVAALRGEDQEVHQAAIRAIVKYRSLAVAALVETLDDESYRVRSRAVAALAQIPGTSDIPMLLPTLVEMIRDRDTSFEYRYQPSVVARELLAKVGAPAVPWLDAALDDADWRVRSDVIGVLTHNRAPEAVQSLTAALASWNADLRLDAARALGEKRGASAVVALIAALSDDNPRVAEQAARSLQSASTRAATPALIEALSSPRAFVRSAVAGALGNRPGKQSVAALVRALQDEDVGVRRATVVSLGRLNDARATPDLVRAYDDDDVRDDVIYALVVIGGPDVLPVLRTALQHPRAAVRRDVAKALGDAADAGGVPALARALTDEMPSVRRSAAAALKRIGPPAAAAVPALTAALSDENQQVRASVRSALRHVET